MALGQRGVASGARSAFAMFKRNPVQFLLAMYMAAACGATNKFQTFPMPWVAGESSCKKEVTKAPHDIVPFVSGSKSYVPTTWLEIKADCKEKAKVFTFVTESFTITTANLVFFGIVKAVFNFVTGVCCDRWGRKSTLVVGWAIGIPAPLMVLFAGSWWTAAFSSVFLGMQQALVWSASIFIMVDYLGREHSGFAIGMNETAGYTSISIMGVVAAAIMDEDDPRAACYYVVLGLVAVGMILGLVALKESKTVAVREEAEATGRSEEAVQEATTTTLSWPSGRSSTVSVPRSAFIYSSFVNESLMVICFAGLMINFISGFAWGLFAKWMKSDYVVDGELQWAGMSKTTVANITLCYGLPKGVLQWIFGFVGDRFGRKWLIVVGLSLCTLGMLILALAGETSDSPEVGFYLGALTLGVGTGVMYTNNLAAICDHSDSTWRASALGTYRFWRDLGYAVGALITGLFADAIGIGGSVLLTAALTALSATLVAVFYKEAQAEDNLKAAGAKEGLEQQAGTL